MLRTALVALLVLACSPAFGQTATCGSRAEILSYLASEYREAPVAIGTGEGGIIEILASPDGATWTALVTVPSGVSCVAGTGEHWEVLPVTPAGKPS